MVAPASSPAQAFTPSSRIPGALLPASPRPFRSNPAIAAISRAPRAAAPPLSASPSLHPATRRTNRLRPKLLRILPPPPRHPILEAPLGRGGGGGGEASHALVEDDDPRELQARFLPLPHEIPAGGLAVVAEETELALLLRQQVGDRPSFPDAGGALRLLLELSAYLVGLLAVQTVCAVWLFGSAGVGEGKSAEMATNARVGEVNGAVPEVGERGLEFERAVSAIQAMARAARAAEAREVAEEDGVVAGLRGDIVDEVNRRLGRLGKRMPGVHFVAKALPNTPAAGDGRKVFKAPAKGFNGSKDYAASTRDLVNGGSQQIDRDGHVKKPSQLHVRRKSNAHGYNVPEKETASSRDRVVSDIKNSHMLGDLNASDREMSEKSRNDHMIGNGRTWNNPVSQELVEDRSPFGEGIHHKQTDSSNKASGMASTTKKMGIPHSQGFLGEKHGSSSTDGNSYTNSEIVSDKKTKHKHLREKAEDSRSDAVNGLWWLKLPYVLAIFLHRGSGRKEFKGLYSLKMDSSSEDGSDSYSIVFEDRVDATNFCYLLESFFENLDDFFADIFPLSIQEVHDAVKSRTLKVIVVRKGQLQLYAGQPLAEAEMQLRSMLD